MIGSILLQVVLIFLNATFASAEIAVISMNETKLKMMAEEKDKRAMKLFALVEQPARFLATIQVAITLARTSWRCLRGRQLCRASDRRADRGWSFDPAKMY